METCPLTAEHTWVEYQGLWGVKSILRDESGPPGPKWDRSDKFFMIYPRLRWEKPLEWLKGFETLAKPTAKRKS
ncbi:MAG: hypothetical protein QM730_10115 [Anaerolineales bacterium]